MAKRIAVLGGNGFVGQRVCRHALKLGIQVVSINRSGAPATGGDWNKNVDWVKADMLGGEADRRIIKDALAGSHGVVSCVGAFGTNEAMMNINGHANVSAVKLAKEAGVQQFTYISTGRSSMPSWVLRGYFEGKILTEKSISEHFGRNGCILRPGFIYGVKQTTYGNIPLQYIGGPMKLVFELTGLHKLRNLPGLSMALTLPTDAEAVGITAAAAAGGILHENSDLHSLILQMAGGRYDNQENGPLLLESIDIDVMGNILKRRK